MTRDLGGHVTACSDGCSECCDDGSWPRTNKELTVGCDHLHAVVQFPCTVTRLFMHAVKQDAPYTHYSQLWPVVFYKYIAQSVEMMIDFWNSKTRTIKIFQNKKKRELFYKPTGNVCNPCYPRCSSGKR